MRQSTVIFGCVLLGFIIYITLRGQLPNYLDLFSGEGSHPSAISFAGVTPVIASSAPSTPGIGGGGSSSPSLGGGSSSSMLSDLSTYGEIAAMIA